MESDSSKDTKPLIKIYGNSALSERVNAFQTKVQSSKQPLRRNSQDKNTKGMDSSDPEYGRPVAGSKTDLRGKAAAAHIGREVMELCSIIKQFGEEQSNGTFEITFKELFDLYQVISNKVVGVLLRGRKHGLLGFEGEMLFQRRDDHVIITLLVDPDIISETTDSTSCVVTH